MTRTRHGTVHYGGTSGSPLHRKLVAELEQNGATLLGFRRAVESAVGARFDEAPKIIPDAYGIRHDIKRVVLFEVYVSHDIVPKKRRSLIAWRDWLAALDWSVKLFMVGANGRMLSVNVDDGDLDEESQQRCIDFLHGVIEP